MVLVKGWPQKTIEQNRVQNRPFQMFPVDFIADVQTIQQKNGKEQAQFDICVKKVNKRPQSMLTPCTFTQSTIDLKKKPKNIKLIRKYRRYL